MKITEIKRDPTTGRIMKGNKSTTTHGETLSGKRTKLYTAWRNMMNRCYQKSVAAYKDYGGRGIEVCEKWHHFENFKSDIGNPPNNKSSLERKDCNGNYDKENCCWIDISLQSKNRRFTKKFTINERVECISTWAKIYDLRYACLYKRLKLGWTIREAVGLDYKKKRTHNGNRKTIS